MSFYKKDIERILNTVKVDDGHIMLGDSIEVPFYDKKITIRQVNWWYEWDKFVYNLGLFLSCYSNVVNTMSLPDGMDQLEDFRKNLRITISNNIHGRTAYLYLCRILGMFGLKKAWMKKRFSIDDYVTAFLYVYIYNIMGVKKNLKAVYSLIGKVR